MADETAIKHRAPLIIGRLEVCERDRVLLTPLAEFVECLEHRCVLLLEVLVQIAVLSTSVEWVLVAEPDRMNWPVERERNA